MKFSGLEETAKDTRCLKYANRLAYMQINLDTDTGEIWGDYFGGGVNPEWKEYHDPAVITICTTQIPLTADQIKEYAEIELECIRRYGSDS